MTKFVEGIAFVTEHCCNCGMPFAMSADFQRRRLNDHKSFYCPRGHGQHYTGQTEAERLRRHLEHEQHRSSQLARQRDEVTRAHRRMRERVRNGVCPCCNRTFQNLLEHMRTEHPDFGESGQLKALRGAFGLSQNSLADEAGVTQAQVSRYERGRTIPDSAKQRLVSWVEEHAA